MKLQHLIIIFLIIIIPISLVMTQYIQSQMETINLQSAYQKSLNNSTKAALIAFQINSLNNNFYSVSDSKIRDVEASINTFYNTMGASMHAYISPQKELSTFIPAVLFTLYDGYYIYSSYENVYEYTGNANDGTKRVQIREDNRNFQQGLHPYIYYSCKYLLNGDIIVVNYTLDNAITVFGDIDGTGQYKTKSGYLIDPSKVTNINTSAKTLVYDGITIGPETLTEHLLFLQDTPLGGSRLTAEDYNYIVYDGQKVYKDATGYFYYDNYKKRYLQSEAALINDYVAKNGGFHSVSAFEYYYNAYNFSKWLVNSPLKNITQEDVIKMEDGITPIGNSKDYLSIDTGREPIFDIENNPDNNPLLSGSTFNSHRMAIIRKSIETNLAAAIANYQSDLVAYEFTLPVFNEEDWYEITNKVSIASFMQGIPIGMKYFNSYSVISNTKNKEVVGEQNIYLITRNSKTNEREYHLPGCIELEENTDLTLQAAYSNLSFLRQDIKQNGEAIAYYYPQSRVSTGTNNDITGCYYCVVNANSTYTEDEIIAGKITQIDWNNSGAEKVMADVTGSSQADNRLKAIRRLYMHALARERYDVYQVNMTSMNI